MYVVKLVNCWKVRIEFSQNFFYRFIVRITAQRAPFIVCTYEAAVCNTIYFNWSGKETTYFNRVKLSLIQV